MNIASAILATPIMLGGKLLRELPGDHDLTLDVSYERQVLEVYVDGKLVAIRPLASVSEMRPADAPVQCPDCTARFANTKGLGGHRRHAHGVKGGTQ